MHNYVAEQGSPHREEMRCAPRCRGKGTGEQAGEAQGSRNKPRKEIGD